MRHVLYLQPRNWDPNLWPSIQVQECMWRIQIRCGERLSCKDRSSWKWLKHLPLMSQQNVVTAGEGAELVDSVPSQTESPGFNPQHHINWMWWPLSAIPAPWGGRSRRIRSSRAYSTTQGAWYQPGLETLSQKPKPKTKRWLLCIMESSAVDSECPRMCTPFIFMINEIGQIQKPTYYRIPLT